MGTSTQIGTSAQYAGLPDLLANGASLSRAPALRKLLLYLWEHRGANDISEYAIAVDVFGKRPDFDPKTDATVRVQISRLRQKLKEYYEKDGKLDPFRITIPAGTHRIEVEYAPPPPAEISVPAKPVPWGRLAAAGAAVLIGWLGWSNYSLRSELAEQQAVETLPALWQSILKPERLTRIVYPIPVFYNWGRLRIRDVDNNDPVGWQSSARLEPFVKQFGRPVLNKSYSVSSDTAAAIQLTRFLADRRKPTDVSATSDLSLDQFGNDNVIFLGIPPTNAALTPYLNKLNFSTNASDGVLSRSPAAGEPSEWLAQREPGKAQTRYGVVAVVPGHTQGSRLMLLLGLDTASLAAALTSPPSLAALTEQWRARGEPVHFEAVLEAERVESKIRRASVAAFRTIATTADGPGK